MAPPSQLQIAISSLQRLLKEEASYYKEQSQQEARIAKLEKEGTGDDDDGNREFQLKQEVRTTSSIISYFVRFDASLDSLPWSPCLKIPGPLVPSSP
ncbi:hypothetical protein KCU88_g184, partial [Aureobasidium melanogenum]